MMRAAFRNLDIDALRTVAVPGQDDLVRSGVNLCVDSTARSRARRQRPSGAENLYIHAGQGNIPLVTDVTKKHSKRGRSDYLAILISYPSALPAATSKVCLLTFGSLNSLGT